MIKKTLLMLLLASSLSVSAEELVSCKVYGFVRSDFNLDTRKVYASGQDLFSLYPLAKDKNSLGEDLNAVSSSSLTSISSRFGLQINANAGLFGAKSAIAKLETDFVGASPSFVLLRIRQAYTQLNWNKSSLLVGQTWHPMVAFGTHPAVLAFNTGALFQPFNRSPQVRYDYLIKSIKLSAAAIYEMQYTSQGPESAVSNSNTSGYSFQRNSLLPELFIGIEKQDKHMLVGLSGSVKSIMPERYIVNNGIKRIHSSLLHTPAVMLYGKWSDKKLSITGKTIVGQNMTHLNIIGGYAITPDHKYIPYNSFSTFLHINYGIKHSVGLLGGYTANLGPKSDLTAGSSIYGFGIDKGNLPGEQIIKDIYRLTPTYSYNYKNWKLGVELEYTNAAWGVRDTKGKIKNTERVSNTRIYAMLAYTF